MEVGARNLEEEAERESGGTGATRNSAQSAWVPGAEGPAGTRAGDFHETNQRGCEGTQSHLTAPLPSPTGLSVSTPPQP